LIEGIDVPNCTLGKDTVLIERNQLAKSFGSQLLGEDDVRGTIAFEDAMRHKPVGSALGLHLLGRFAECESFGLRANVGDEQIVMATDYVQGLAKADKVARDETRTLMDELVEGVLSVGAGLAPVDGASVVVHARALQGDVLTVALHCQLLQVSGK